MKIQQQQQQGQIICIINANTDKEQKVTIDSRIFNFDTNQPYPIPSSIIASSEPLYFLNLFIAAHHFDSRKLIIRKPVNFSNIQDYLDDSTYHLVSAFQNLSNLNEGLQIIKFAHFIQFYQLVDAVSLVIVSNFWKPQTNANQLEQTEEQKLKSENEVADLFDLLIQYERMIMMSESIEKEDIYNSHLKKFCQNSSFQFGSYS